MVIQLRHSASVTHSLYQRSHTRITSTGLDQLWHPSRPRHMYVNQFHPTALIYKFIFIICFLIISSDTAGTEKVARTAQAIDPLLSRAHSSTLGPLRPVVAPECANPVTIIPQLFPNLENANHSDNNLLLSVNAASFPESLLYARIYNKTNRLFSDEKSSSSLLNLSVSPSSTTSTRPILGSRNSQPTAVWRPY